MALEAGRNYIILPDKQIKPSGLSHRRLNLDMLDQIEKEMLEGNRRELLRSESMNRIKLRAKIYKPEDSVMRLAKRNTLARRRPSVPQRLDFEAYKTEKAFDATTGDSEREWTREIWNEWFDEVIPLLDGTFARDSRNKTGKDDETLVEGIRFNNIIISEKKCLKSTLYSCSI